jgi:hypothetical protein
MTNPNTHAELLNTPDPAETLDEDVLRADPVEPQQGEEVAPHEGAIWYDPASDPNYDPEYDRWGHDRDHWGHHRDNDHWGRHRDHHDRDHDHRGQHHDRDHDRDHGGHHRDHDRDHWGNHRDHDRDHDHRGHHHDRDHDRDDWGHHRDRDHGHRDHDRWEHDGGPGQNPGPVYQDEPEHDYNHTAPVEDGEIHIDPIESQPTGEDVLIEPAPEPEPAMTDEPAEEVHADVMPIA